MTKEPKENKSLGVKEMLREDLPANAIRQREQGGMTFDYLEGWWVIQNANRIFGEENWSDRILPESVQHFKLPNTNSGKTQGCFKMVVEVNAVIDGKEVTHYGIGSCVYAGENNFEMGMKGAETDALKRALRKFGKQFGNELYKKDEDSDLTEGGVTTSTESTIEKYHMDPNQVVPNCDKCGLPMVLRSGKWGPFWSCSGYKPDKNGCNNIYNVDEVDLDGTVHRKAKDIGQRQAANKPAPQASPEEVPPPSDEEVPVDDLPF